MSWNPRRFLATVGNLEWCGPDRSVLTETGTHLWLTEDAVERINAGAKSRALALAPLADIPAEGMTLGVSIFPDRVFVFPPADTQALLHSMTEGCTDSESSMFFVACIGAEPAFVGRVFTKGSEERIAEITAKGDESSSERQDALNNWHGVARLALTLYTQPVEQDAAAITVERQTVSTHKKKNTKARKARTRDISVIDVRRDSIRYVGSGEHRRVEHDHRWVVRGHPRMQAYGPGRSLRKLIWVSEQVRGPEGKPLLRTPRVHRL